MTSRTDVQPEPEDDVASVLVRLVRDPRTPAPSRHAAMSALRVLADSVSLTDGKIILDTVRNLLDDKDTDIQVAAITVMTAIRRQRLRWHPRNMFPTTLKWLAANPAVLGILGTIVAGIPIAAIIYALISGVSLVLNLVSAGEVVIGLFSLVLPVSVVVMLVRARQVRLRQLTHDLGIMPKARQRQRYRRGTTAKSRREGN